MVEQISLLSVAVLGAVGAAFLIVVLMRRSVLIRGLGTFDCSLHRETHRGIGRRWTLGVARYEADRLDWFRVLTISPRPSRSLARDRLVILERQIPEGTATHSVLPGWVVVRCAYGALTLEFAMSDPAYSGLSAWLESGPPGVPRA